jgi:hypothetical protein
LSSFPPIESTIPGGNKHMIFISQQELGCYMGKMVIGLRQLKPEEFDTYSMKSKPKTPKNATGYIDHPYQLRVVQSACYYMNEDNQWSTKGLWVSGNGLLRQLSVMRNRL